jgi:hypothetical protein
MPELTWIQEESTLEASHDERIYTVLDLEKNGAQLDIRITGDNPNYPRLIVRMDSVTDVQRFAESLASGDNDVNLPPYPLANELGGRNACVYPLDGVANPRK